MTDNWDFYFLRVDDLPASVYVDLGTHDTAPNAALPHMAYVRLQMNAPLDNGLSSQAEFDALVAVEDALRDALSDDATQYVGRCTTNSCRDFFFYVARPQEWHSRVASCMAAFADYRYEADTQEDEEWACYLNYLYPSPEEREVIENRRVCASLESRGDDLSEPREIDHWAYFPEAGSAQAYATEAIGLGFQVRAITPPDESSSRHCVQFWRTDLPSYGDIDDVTRPLYELAIKHGGDYDGWETFVIAAESR